VRSTRRAVSSPLPAALVLGLLIAPDPGRVAAAALDPECPVYRGEPVPEGFAGCAELERQVRDTASFRTPDGFRLDLYESLLDEFFQKLCHRNPETGWVRDKRVRDTGPYLGTLAGGEWTDVAYHGTHQPVVIWYDARMYRWLKRHRPGGGEARPGAAPKTAADPIPDGAIMVKEMFPAPAARCAAYEPETLEPSPQIGVALMIRDNRGSRDGWFWGVWWKGTPSSPGFNPDWPAGAAKGNRLPFMGFGQYCMNCHASAVDNLTFADLKNVEGEPGRPNVYLSQNFVFESSLAAETGSGQHRAAVDTSDDPLRHDQPLAAYNPAFTARFALADQPRPPDRVGDRLIMPSQTYDNVWVPALGPGGVTAESEFVTSDQCIGCHDAGSTGLQFDMTAPDPEVGKLLNLSPYATWRTSPMGLGGRDPIFFAQLASETQTFHPDQSELVQDVCLGCHGIMGQRQFKIDHAAEPDDCSATPAVHPRPRRRRALPLRPGPEPGARLGALRRPRPGRHLVHRLPPHGADRRGGPARCGASRRTAASRSARSCSTRTSRGFARTFTGSFLVGPPDRAHRPVRGAEDPSRWSTPWASSRCTTRRSELRAVRHLPHRPPAGSSTATRRWATPTSRPPTPSGRSAPTAPADAGGASCRRRRRQGRVLPGCHMPSRTPTGSRYRSKIASIQEYSNFPQAEHTLGPEDDRSAGARRLRPPHPGRPQRLPARDGAAVPGRPRHPHPGPDAGSFGVDPLHLTEQAMLDQAANDTATVARRQVARDGGSLRARSP
jgi:hypothetical protein